MARGGRPRLPLLALALWAPSAWAFKYRLHDVVDVDKQLIFTERHMFGTNAGPEMMPQGEAFIQVDGRVTYEVPKLDAHPAMNVSIMFLGLDDGEGSEKAMPLCDELAEGVPSFMQDLYRSRPEPVGDMTLEDGTQVTQYKAHIHHKFRVQQKSWYSVAFRTCPGLYKAKLVGEITFRNPYGYLPGMFYGYLPFEATRMIAFLLLGAMFLYFTLRHSDSVLPLHHGILAVLAIAEVESITWFIAYTVMNKTGQVYCCPFPPEVIAAMSFEILRRTFSRTLLLLVCLGYGIVRPKIHSVEMAAVVILTGLYLLASTVDVVSQIVTESNVHSEAADDVPLGWQVPVLFMDIIFLSWIYLALSSTVRILGEYQQTYKLLMYKRLAAVIGAFVALFSLLTVLMLGYRAGWVSWPWEWVWVQAVLWEILNFGVLAAVSFIWRPSDTSKMLSYMSQLPTTDPDDDMAGGPDNPWADDDGVEMQRRFDELPALDDDSEFGLGESGARDGHGADEY